MRRTTSVALLATAITGSSFALTSASATGGDTTLQLRSESVTFKYFDVGKEGESVGDHFVFSDDVVRSGKRIGSADGECTTTRLPNATSRWQQCVATITLQGGQLTLQGAIRFHTKFEAARVAVTGGTGAYDEAQGEAILRFPPDGSTTWHIDLDG